MLLPIRPPTTESASRISRIVAVVRVARITRPTSPSLLSTVMSAVTPARVPASIVTVRENDWLEPTAMTWAGTSEWPVSAAAWARPSYSARRLRSRSEVSTC